ncbi:MAG TPA: biotin transporter BioY [Blastocatellia bacterium]|nr:biotin transporter BioY [Blastocatellia bacterium]
MQSDSTKVSNEYRRAVAFNRALVKAGGVALFVALTAAASRLKVFLPFSPVPMTMQPLAVLLAGAILGPWLGALSQLAYLGLGLSGAPVFAGVPGAGLAVLVGPTGGYLMSYPLVAMIVGWSVGPSSKSVRIAGGLLLGLIVIYCSGVARLLMVTAQDPVAAFQVGVEPFLLADLIKVALATLLVKGWKTVVRR